MRIVVLQDYLRNGGTERQSIFLANFFKSRGHDVTLVTFRPGGVLLPEAEKANINIDTLQSFDLGLNFLAPGLAGKLKSISPDVILCMGRMANNKAGRLQRQFPKCLVIATLRTGKTLSRRSLKSISGARMLLSNTRWWLDELVRLGIETGESHVVNNSLTRNWDLSVRERLRRDLRKHYKVDEDCCVFLNVSGFRPGKQQDVMIEIFSKLRSENAQLWLVGDGVQQQYCKSVSDRLGMGSRVKFVGYTDDPLKYYMGADVALSTSVEDAQPNFLVEAQATGLPVIAFDYRGVKECFNDQKSGILIENGDRNSFLVAMQKMLSEAGMRKSMSEPAQEWAARNFHAETNAEKYLKLISDEIKNQVRA